MSGGRLAPGSGCSQVGKCQGSRAANATTAPALCPSSFWCGAGWKPGSYQVLSPFQGIQAETSLSLSFAAVAAVTQISAVTSGYVRA